MNNKATKPGRLKSAVLNWLGFSFSDIAQWRALYGREAETGVSVTPETSMKVSAFYACVRLISQTIATLPVGIYRYGDTRVEDRKHPLSNLLSMRPNPDQTASVFWESMMASALIAGNGWAEKRMISGKVARLDFLHPYRLRWRRDGGRYVYVYTDEDGKQRDIEQSSLFHLPGFSIDGRFGISAIEYGVEVLGSAISGNTAANKTFKNGMAPTVAFEMERILSPEQRETFRESIAAISGAINAGKSPVLEGGMKASVIGIKPSDAQLLESRNFSAEEICRWFGVPPSMVGLTDKASSWASSSEALNRWFLQYTLLPWLVKTQQAIDTQLMSPVERTQVYSEFAVEGLLRADSGGRASLYTSALQNGWMSRNEVRRLENLPKVDGGDELTVQSNLIPLSALGATGTESNSVRNALLNWLKEPNHEA